MRVGGREAKGVDENGERRVDESGWASAVWASAGLKWVAVKAVGSVNFRQRFRKIQTTKSSVNFRHKFRLLKF
mgnify:FL=1